MAIKSSNQITFTEHKKIVEIKEWYLATSVGTGVTTETAGWTEDIQTINYTNKYLWNYEEVVYSIGSSDISEPVVIGFYGQGTSGKDGQDGKDGADGRGITSIVNYYQVTSDMNAPSTTTAWPTKVPLLSPTNKYLWNYEVITYTDNTTTETDPAIIGVYGDSGTDAIVFEIYSAHGFMFKEDLESIELQLAAFKGGEAITGATYTWSWWDSGEESYFVITETTEKTFTVSESAEYAFASLKCTMSYDGKIYEDYVVLTSETVIYSSVVKFFNGSNIFNATDPYIVAYIDLYQNNHLVETVATESYCTGVSSVSSAGVITADLDDSFSNGDKMYFVYQDDNGLYQIALGEYTSGTWNKIDNNTLYTYTNTLYPDIQSNVVVISKESINKSQNIDFTVYKDGIYVSSTNAIVIDINDPIISSTEPTNPNYGQLWLDTSTNPYSLKIFTQIEGEAAGEWIYFVQQNGKTVYTSKPSEYAEGDLWILASGETCGGFGPGSMLKATTTSSTFDASHWVDADEETTELKNNIKQYFGFDPDTGLKIGQTDDAFYVNISSSEMGFYDNTGTSPQKVVYISNSTANINNVLVEGSAEFDCNATFNEQVQMGNFVWKTETNGSFSLALIS